MIFTSGQIIALFIVTEFFVYAIISNITGTIKHCSMAKTYRKAIESGENEEETQNERKED